MTRLRVHSNDRLRIEAEPQGPEYTITVRHYSSGILKRLVHRMKTLANRRPDELTIRSDAEFELVGIDRIHMGLMRDRSREVLDVRIEKDEAQVLIWGNDAEGWEANVEFAESVVRADYPCHAYLGENAEGNAIVVFSNEVGPELFLREEPES